MFMLKLSEFFLTLMMVMTALTKQKVFTEIMIRIGTKKKIILDGRSWNNEKTLLYASDHGNGAPMLFGCSR